MRASSVVKRQSPLAPDRFRSVCHASTPLQYLHVGQSSFQALAHQHREFYLHHVQPRAVNRGVDKLDPSRQAPCLLGREDLVEGRSRCRKPGPVVYAQRHIFLPPAVSSARSYSVCQAYVLLVKTPSIHPHPFSFANAGGHSQYGRSASLNASMIASTRLKTLLESSLSLGPSNQRSRRLSSGL